MHKEVVGSALHLDEQLVMDHNSSERRVDGELWKQQQDICMLELIMGHNRSTHCKATFNQRACLQLDEQLVIEYMTSERKVVDKLQRLRQDIQILELILSNDQYVASVPIKLD